MPIIFNKSKIPTAGILELFGFFLNGCRFWFCDDRFGAGLFADLLGGLLAEIVHLRAACAAGFDHLYLLNAGEAQGVYFFNAIPADDTPDGDGGPHFIAMLSGDDEPFEYLAFALLAFLELLVDTNGHADAKIVEPACRVVLG